MAHNRYSFDIATSHTAVWLQAVVEWANTCIDTTRNPESKSFYAAHTLLSVVARCDIYLSFLLSICWRIYRLDRIHHMADKGSRMATVLVGGYRDLLWLWARVVKTPFLAVGVF